VAAARHLLAQYPLDLIISDDGMQHYRLQRDLELVLIDGQRGFGNGQLLPVGPLREPVSRLANASAVVVNSASVGSHFALPAGLPGFRMALQAGAPVALVGSAHWTGEAVTLVAAIGNQQRFIRTAEACGVQVAATQFFPDHFAFSADSLAAIDGPVLMTEKDAVKCRPFAKADWFYLPVQAELTPIKGSPELIPWLLQRIQPRS